MKNQLTIVLALLLLILILALVAMNQIHRSIKERPTLPIHVIVEQAPIKSDTLRKIKVKEFDSLKINRS